MAFVKYTRQYALTSTPVEVAEANTDRQFLAFRFIGDGYAYVGPDDTVSPTTGFPWAEADGPFSDASPTPDAWYAMGPNGGRLSVIEFIDE